MRRPTFAVLAALCIFTPAAADDMEDCRYSRLGKDEADVARRRTACDRIIAAGKGYTAEQRGEAYSKRASWASQEHRPKDAIADFDQAIALDPSKVDWRRDRAYLLYFDEQFDRAIKDFDAVLAANPADAHVAFFRGLAWLDKGDEKRGFADLASGIELAPEDYWYRYQRAVELVKRKRSEEALPDLDKAIAIKAKRSARIFCGPTSMISAGILTRRSPTWGASSRSNPSAAPLTSTVPASTRRWGSSIARSPTTTR